MSEIAIRVEHLGKQYRLGAQQAGYKTFRESLVNTANAPLRWLKGERKAEKNTFWALDDVSFEVKHGEAIGIIGRNGAGKSTLLKILSRITSPTRGRVDIYGRVGSLLEVGTGFHPELSGRENIYLNGAILGMSRVEIMRKFDEIVDFSGIEKFLDTPVKHYSSGMYVRLAFAVAAHLEPEILVVDEVLAVGDAAFQKRCLGKMGDVAKQGRTVLFVSHNMGAVKKLCSRGILLENGFISSQGIIEDVINKYLESTYQSNNFRKSEICFPENPELNIQILRIALMDNNGNLSNVYGIWDSILLELYVVVRKKLHGSNLAIQVSRDGDILFNSFDIDESPEYFEARDQGYYHYCIPFPKNIFPKGTYSIDVSSGISGIGQIEIHTDVLLFEIEVNQEDFNHKSYSRTSRIIVPMVWDIRKVSSYIFDKR
ncbi:MAG: hypothetical protein A2X25_02155 [Chloroflexi bacterium GWB2_49_20]|nr:MAG: hypothetical protein A2X25_02155 [Chloroflexi bacterium GWB2_49_20]OGN78248.1 MAG: hypothetical protein A2X26_14760 [Chloroflexi bacterium GWC2_49_37]OGN85284.1 MAG: hypothetical protein A2X27_07415 [Chloroflexi bacterium GWD2_49_16]